MKTTIEVKNKREGDTIRAALDDPAVRAFVMVVGILTALPSDRARARVLAYAIDLYNEPKTDEANTGEAVTP